MILDKQPDSKALIFDLDGTLADTMDLHFEAWMWVSKNFAFPYDREIFWRWAGMPTADILARISETESLNLPSIEIETEKDQYFLSHIHKIKPIPFMLDIVKKYHSIIPISVGTGSHLEMAKTILEAVNMDRYFEIIVGSDSVQKAKPAPDTFLECARRMDTAAECCEVFEDGNSGIEAGHAAGMIVTDIRKLLETIR